MPCSCMVSRPCKASVLTVRSLFSRDQVVIETFGQIPCSARPTPSSCGGVLRNTGTIMRVNTLFSLLSALRQEPSFPQGKPKLWRSLRSPKTSNGDRRSSRVRGPTGRLRTQETGTIMRGEARTAVGVWHAKPVSPLGSPSYGTLFDLRKPRMETGDN